MYEDLLEIQALAHGSTQRATIRTFVFRISLAMAFATAQDPTMDSIEADEMAAAAAHAGIPVEPKSPTSQVTPPGLDIAQLLAEFAKMKEKMDAM